MNFKDEVSYDNTVFRTYVPSPEDRVDRSVKIYDGLVYIWCCNVIAKDADTSSGRFLLPTRVVQNPDDEKPAVLIRNDWQVAGKMQSMSTPSSHLMQPTIKTASPPSMFVLARPFKG